MSNTNLVLGSWKHGEWPEYVTVSHEGVREPGQRYVPELTCEWIWGEDWCESSTEGPRELHWANWYLDCGCWEGDEDEFCDFDDPEVRPDSDWAFCPRCGAKVVME